MLATSTAPFESSWEDGVRVDRGVEGEWGWGGVLGRVVVKGAVGDGRESGVVGESGGEGGWWVRVWV